MVLLNFRLYSWAYWTVGCTHGFIGQQVVLMGLSDSTTRGFTELQFVLASLLDSSTRGFILQYPVLTGLLERRLRRSPRVFIKTWMSVSDSNRKS